MQVNEQLDDVSVPHLCSSNDQLIRHCGTEFAGYLLEKLFHPEYINKILVFKMFEQSGKWEGLKHFN